MNEPLDRESELKVESDEVARALQDAFPEEIPENLDRIMTASLDRFREDLEHHPYVRRLGSGRSTLAMGWGPHSSNRLAWLGGTGLVLALVVLSLFAGNSAPSWADVVQRFQSVKSFSAVVYRREDTFAETKQYEFWASSSGSERIRSGTEVVFAKNGKVVRAFDLENRSETQPDNRIAIMHQALGSSGEFSLETMMRRFCGDWVESTLQVNPHAVISEDLVVFDVEHPGTPDWVRIWALRESKLPVQIRAWEPRDGECIDVFFSYSKEQPDTFFDPDAFARKMEDRSIHQAGLAYAFLEDPTDKKIQPGRVNEEFVFSTVTRTLDGESWSVGNHKGKVVLLGFWDTNSGYDYESWWKELYGEFGDREDFVMAGVALDAEAGPVRKYCEENGIEWVQLHEPGKGYKNALAQAFGGEVRSTVWLIWRDGTIEKLFHGGSQVVAALVGLTYETQSFLAPKISHRIQEGEGMNQEEAKAFCGEPDETETQGDHETWWYRLLSEDETTASDVSLVFDSSGKNVNLICQRRILRPALATIFISEEYWKEKIEPQIDPTLLPAHKHKYGIVLSMKCGNRGSMIGAGHPWTGFGPGQEYLRQVHPGTYDFSIEICDKRTFRNAQKIPLVQGVDLVVDETREVRLE